MEIIFGLVSALFFGCSDFCARFATRRVGIYRSLFYLQCVGFLVLSIFLLFTGSLTTLGHHADWRPWFWGVVAGVLNTLSYLALYRAFAIGKLAVVAPVASSYAAITVLLSLFSGEVLKLVQLGGIAAVLLGVVLASLGSEEESEECAKVRHHARSRVPPGVGWALLAAVGLGVTLWLLGFAVTSALGESIPIWLFRLAGILLLAFLAPLGRQNLRLPRDSGLTLVICIGVLDTAGFVAETLGYGLGHVSVVSTLSSLYSVVAVLLAAIFLRERLRALQWLGIVVLLVGVVLTHA